MKEKEISIKKQLGEIDDIGVIYEVKDEIAYAKGLMKGGMSEQVEFIGTHEKGIINYLDNKGAVGIIILGETKNIKAGMIVKRVKKLPVIKAGDEVLGKILNPMGINLETGEEIKGEEVNIERIAPSIIERQPVREPLETGIKFIDSMIPIGCGQRELIIGDKKTGKTAIAIDTIINQKNTEVICIYVAIGQKKSSVARVAKVLKEKGCMGYTCIVSASASDPAALQYLAPYAGCAIGEYFMNKGNKVVIIYDDLSKHAVAYRQMALLLRRPPGREGYPGDVFYLHSRLLERAAKLLNKKDSKSNLEIESGSLTALPVIETIQGDVSAYIPTNVISITDGQIFLEADLFNKGIRPAINPGISVSRVGSAVQNKIIKKLAGSLKLELAQYREMEEFARLGLSLDEATELLLEKGKRLTKLMNQPHSSPILMVGQIIVLCSGIYGLLNNLSIDVIPLFERKLLYVIYHKVLLDILDKLLRNNLYLNLISFIVNLLKLKLSVIKN